LVLQKHSLSEKLNIEGELRFKVDVLPNSLIVSNESLK
jgi:hypothetical protein